MTVRLLGWMSHLGNIALDVELAGVTETFYLLQEDNTSRIILEDGSGFLQLQSAP